MANRKRQAKDKLRRAVNAGRITPGPCIICGIRSKSNHGHHLDYSRPLDVIWYCKSHHHMTHMAGTAIQRYGESDLKDDARMIDEFLGDTAPTSYSEDARG